MDNAVTHPQDFRRRSFIYRELLGLGARFTEVDGAAIAHDYGGSEADESKRASSLGLSDLSPLPRCGFKGAGTVEWLTAQGIEVPAEPNRAQRQGDGCVAARLSGNEVLVLGDLAGAAETCARLEKSWWSGEQPPASPRGFPVPRQDSHAWLGVSGRHGAAMLAKLCGVDLRPAVFANGAVAQTSVARLNAIVVRDDLGARLCYHLLPDSASAAYLWHCLMDAGAEFGVGPVGLAALRRLTEDNAS